MKISQPAHNWWPFPAPVGIYDDDLRADAAHGSRRQSCCRWGTQLLPGVYLKPFFSTREFPLKLIHPVRLFLLDSSTGGALVLTDRRASLATHSSSSCTTKEVNSGVAISEYSCSSKKRSAGKSSCSSSWLSITASACSSPLWSH